IASLRILALFTVTASFASWRRRRRPCREARVEPGSPIKANGRRPPPPAVRRSTCPNGQDPCVLRFDGIGKNRKTPQTKEREQNGVSAETRFALVRFGPDLLLGVVEQA